MEIWEGCADGQHCGEWLCEGSLCVCKDKVCQQSLMVHGSVLPCLHRPNLHKLRSLCVRWQGYPKQSPVCYSVELAVVPQSIHLSCCKKLHPSDLTWQPFYQTEKNDLMTCQVSHSVITAMAPFAPGLRHINRVLWESRHSWCPCCIGSVKKQITAVSREKILP